MDLGEDLLLAWMKYGPLDFFFQVPHHSSKSKMVEVHGGYSVEKFRVLESEAIWVSVWIYLFLIVYLILINSNQPVISN